MSEKEYYEALLWRREQDIENLKGERAAIEMRLGEELTRVRTGLKKLLMACDRHFAAAADEWSLDLWDAYEDARKRLDDPVINYPGGCEGTHYHPFGWIEPDGCDDCEDGEADREAA